MSPEDLKKAAWNGRADLVDLETRASIHQAPTTISHTKTDPLKVAAAIVFALALAVLLWF